MADRMNTYHVVIRRRDEADLRAFQILAESLQYASELAEKVVARLSSEVIGKFSGDGGGRFRSFRPDGVAGWFRVKVSIISVGSDAATTE